MSAHAGALEAVERIVNRGGEPGDVRRAVVDALHARVATFAWVELVLADGSAHVRGAPTRDAARARIAFAGADVGSLAAGPAAALAEEDERLLGRVATLVSPYCRLASRPGGRPGA